MTAAARQLPQPLTWKTTRDGLEATTPDGRTALVWCEFGLHCWQLFEPGADLAYRYGDATSKAAAKRDAAEALGLVSDIR